MTDARTLELLAAYKDAIEFRTRCYMHDLPTDDEAKDEERAKQALLDHVAALAEKAWKYDGLSK